MRRCWLRSDPGRVQLACLGIIGQYLGRTYEESKGRPLFIIWEDTRRPTERRARPGARRLEADRPVMTDVLVTGARGFVGS